MSITWITWLMKCIGLDLSTTPSAEEADHLTLSNQCVRDIASQVAAGRGTLLAGRQCRDLSLKLLKAIGNIQELVSQFEASSTIAFRPALENFHRIAEKSRLLVNDCCRADWCKASVFQIQNEEAFREILLEVGLCYNAIYEQAKGMSLAEGLVLEVEDLRLGPTFGPASEGEVVEDQQTLQRRLEDLAKNSGSSNDQILARYLLSRLVEGISEEQRIEDACIMYDAQKLRVTETELHGTWDVASQFIGKGSGAIALCRTKWLGISCARKFFPQEEDANFRKEAALLASLNHPNIVKFFCCGASGSEGERQCFIGMELMEMSLADLIDKSKKAGHFPMPVALDIILQIARGMLYLHDLRIAHRDLKPHNVVVAKSQRNTFCVKLVDFGMSKTKIQVSLSNTVSQKNCGTTIYRAPEAFKEAANAAPKQKVKWFRADVYSFAVTCWAILSMEQPYANAGSGPRLYKKLVTGLRPEVPLHCPETLSDLLKECWADNWNARPKFSNICERLEKYKHDELLKGPVSVTEGMHQIEKVDLSSSYTHIETMLTKRSQLRTPVRHLATIVDDEVAANASDDELEAVEEPITDGMDLEWISLQRKTFIVSNVTGDVDDTMKVELKKACEEFCKEIDLTRIPTTVERGQAMQDIVDHLQSTFPPYNVMVVYPKHLQHFKECAHCSITLIISDYTIGSAQVYVFKHGDFTLLGDGGFINWCFSGNHQRKNYKVTFWDNSSEMKG